MCLSLLLALQVARLTDQAELLSILRQLLYRPGSVSLPQLPVLR